MIQIDDSNFKQKAINIAIKAHEDQTDRAGRAYIHHPLTVAQNVEIASGKDECYLVGVLHDLLEDTSITEADLLSEDLKHNMDLSRLKNPTEKDYERCKKYQKSFDFLLE